MKRSGLVAVLLTSAFVVVSCGGGGGDGGVIVPLPEYPGKTLYYVNAAAVDDSGDGLTPATAKQRIQAAIDAATAPAAVLIAEGTYTVDSTPGTDTHVVLKDDVSLYGGYNTAFSKYDPAMYVAEIVDVNNDLTNLSLDPGRAVLADGPLMTNNTIVDGLKIVGGSGNYSSAVVVTNSANPVIRNCNIDGGSGTIGVTGILTTTGSPVIDSNKILAGFTDGDIAAGIWLSGAGTPEIVNNVIIAGDSTCTSSYGILSSSEATIRNNTIDGGSAGIYSNGIYIDNTFAGGHVIQNNIVFTSGANFYRTCISEGNANDPALLQNNDLFDCETALYAANNASNTGNCPFGNSTDCYTQIADVNNETLTTNAAAGTADGNISVNPEFADVVGGDFHLTVSSPAAVITRGLDLSTSFTDDFDGVTRDIPWSIGAYEQAQPEAKKIYITTTVPSGNHGGVPGADAICNDVSYGYPGAGTYKAFISDGVDRIASVTANTGDGQIDWILHPGVTYVQDDGITQIDEADGAGLFSHPLPTPMHPTTKGFWSGLNEDWTSSAENCLRWTDSSGVERGRYGYEGGTSFYLSWGAPGAFCNVSAAVLLCVEQ